MCVSLERTVNPVKPQRLHSATTNSLSVTQEKGVKGTVTKQYFSTSFYMRISPSPRVGPLAPGFIYPVK